MTRRVATRNTAVASVFATLLRILPIACSVPPPPSEQQLAMQFMRDSASYQRVLSMFLADSSIRLISSGSLWRVGQSDDNVTAAQVGVTDARLAEYRRILGALGVTLLVRWAPDQVAFLTWSRGYNHHRGIAWLHEPTQVAWRRIRVITASWYTFED